MNTPEDSKMTSQHLIRFAIAGHGLEAWLTANHLLARLGSKRIEVTVCPVEGSQALDSLYTIWPAGPNDGLSTIGLPGNALVRQCRASFSLGTGYTEFFRPYGTIGLDFFGAPFHHHWLRAQGDADPSGFFSWSPGTVAMRKQVFAPAEQGSAIGKLHHGVAMHIDVALLTALLRERALRNGVKLLPGTLSSINTENDTDQITALHSSEAASVTAELYIDCSGPERALSGGSEVQDWIDAASLGRYQISFTARESQDPPPPYHWVNTSGGTRSLEIPGDGWNLDITCSPVSAGKGPALSPGHLAEPWKGNCLALGSAAATLLPVEPVQAKFLATSLKRFIDLLPGRDCDACEIAEYNHLSLTDLLEIQDMAAAYNIKTDPDSAKLHESLQERIDLFEHRGWIAPPDSEFFEPGDWASTFIQVGLKPGKADRLAKRIPLDQLENRLKRLKQQIEQIVSGFPPHSAYLHAVKSAKRA